MIYFIHGPDRLLARQSAHAIASEMDPDGSNTSWLDGREASLERIAAAVGTASFFGMPRVVVVADLFARAGREASADGTDTAEADRQGRGSPGVGPLLASVPGKHGLILLEPGLSAAPAAIRSVTPPVTVIASVPPRGNALLTWMADAARRVGSSIDRRSAQLLAETLFPQTWDRAPNNPRFDRPPDMTLISNEIEKLALAAYPRPISAAQIREMVPGGSDQRVFRFLDAAVGGDLRLAIDEMERLRHAGDEPAMILAQLLGQIELGAVAVAAHGKDPGMVARDLGSIPAGRMSAIMSSEGRRRHRGAHMVAAAADTDRRLKRGQVRMPADALHHLVLALAVQRPAIEDGRSP